MEHTTQSQPSPEMIMKIGTGFWPSKILLAAVQFELFTLLAKNKKMNAADIKSHIGLGCTDRHVYDFLDTLTAFGFLVREGVWDGAAYANGVDTDLFLDKAKPSYIGGILEMANSRLYSAWGNLEAGLITGQPQNELKDGGENPFDELYKSPDKLNEFINAMSGIQMGNFSAFAQKFDFSSYKTLLDVGGSGAMLSIMVAKYNAHMSCVSFDLPPVAPVAEANIGRFQLSSRVKTKDGDFFKDQLPQADIVVMGNILHDWDEDKKLFLMKAAYQAVNDGGAFIAIENVIDDDRRQNVFGLMMSLNMLIETPGGFDYSFADFTGWAKAAGFKRTELLPLAGPASAVIAYK